MTEIRKRRIKKKKFTEEEIKLISFYEEKIIKAEELISEWKDVIDELTHEWQEYIYNNIVFAASQYEWLNRRDCKNVHRRAVLLN